MHTQLPLHFPVPYQFATQTVSINPDNSTLSSNPIANPFQYTEIGPATCGSAISTGYGYPQSVIPGSTLISVPQFCSTLPPPVQCPPQYIPTAVPADSCQPPSANQFAASNQQGGNFNFGGPTMLYYQIAPPVVEQPAAIPCGPFPNPPPVISAHGVYSLPDGTIVHCYNPEPGQYVPIQHPPPGFHGPISGGALNDGQTTGNCGLPSAIPGTQPTPLVNQFQAAMMKPLPCQGIFCDSHPSPPVMRNVEIEARPMAPPPRFVRKSQNFNNVQNGMFPRVKTKTCQHFISMGFCKFGNNCMYIHPTTVSHEAATMEVPKAKRTVSVPMESRHALSAPSGMVAARLYSSTPVSRRALEEGYGQNYNGMRNYRRNFGLGVGCTKPKVIDGPHPKDMVIGQKTDEANNQDGQASEGGGKGKETGCEE